MVTHQRGVGLVTLKHAYHARWELIKTVGPDVLVATEDTYTAAEIAELEARYCGRVEVLERMATVSTSARLRRIQLGIPEPDAPDGPGPADPAGDELARARPAGELKQILLYLPVIHRGYEALFARHPDAGQRAAARCRVPGRAPRAWARTSGRCRPSAPREYLRLALPGHRHGHRARRPARRRHRRPAGPPGRGGHP